MNGFFAPQPWTIHAACRGMNADLFFPELGEDASHAKAVCAECTVRAECLQYAIDEGITVGVFGGLAPRERRRGRRPAEHGTRRTMRACNCPVCVARLERERRATAISTAESKARRRLRVVPS